jgi:hypothetical protein
MDKKKSRNKCLILADWFGGLPRYSLFLEIFGFLEYSFLFLESERPAKINQYPRRGHRKSKNLVFVQI